MGAVNPAVLTGDDFEEPASGRDRKNDWQPKMSVATVDRPDIIKKKSTTNIAANCAANKTAKQLRESVRELNAVKIAKINDKIQMAEIEHKCHMTLLKAQLKAAEAKAYYLESVARGE